MNISSNATLFSSGSFGAITGGAVKAFITPSTTYGAYTYSGVVSNKMRWAVRSTGGQSKYYADFQQIFFKSKMPFGKYKTLEFYLYYVQTNSTNPQGFSPKLWFCSSSDFTTASKLNSSVATLIKPTRYRGVNSDGTTSGWKSYKNDIAAFTTTYGYLHVQCDISSITSDMFLAFDADLGYGADPSGSIYGCYDISYMALLTTAIS